jgi:hypothetical protein
MIEVVVVGGLGVGVGCCWGNEKPPKPLVEAIDGTGPGDDGGDA